MMLILLASQNERKIERKKEREKERNKEAQRATLNII
jgi:hypothetical protein